MAHHRFQVGKQSYNIRRVPMEEFDDVWDSAILLVSSAIKGARGAGGVDGEISFADLDLGSVGDALAEARSVLGWKTIYKVLGPTMAKHCELDNPDMPSRMDAIWNDHWNEHGPGAFLQWLIEALKWNCADFLDGAAKLLRGQKVKTR